jgi:hypothetical protein
LVEVIFTSNVSAEVSARAMTNGVRVTGSSCERDRER